MTPKTSTNPHECRSTLTHLIKDFYKHTSEGTNSHTEEHTHTESPTHTHTHKHTHRRTHTHTITHTHTSTHTEEHKLTKQPTGPKDHSIIFNPNIPDQWSRLVPVGYITVCFLSATVTLSNWCHCDGVQGSPCIGK